MPIDPFWDGISPDAIKSMDADDTRRLNNLKKAVYQCDQAIIDGRIEDDCLAALCRGIETAQKLRRSLQGVPSNKLSQDSKKHFIEFIHLRIPEATVTVFKSPQATSPTIPHRPSIAEAAYEVRCKAVHENESLNSAESPSNHIQIDWDIRPPHMGKTVGDTHYFSGDFLTQQLRRILAPFVMYVDSVRKGKISVHLFPPLGSIRPD